MTDGRWRSSRKKEQLEVSRSYEKLSKNLGGIRKMKGKPDAVFIVDTAEEETAVKEAQKLGIPVIGIVDTNAIPTPITFPIPGNDDAIRSITLFARTVAESIEEGKRMRGEGRDVSVDMAAARRRSAGSASRSTAEAMRHRDARDRARSPGPTAGANQSKDTSPGEHGAAWKSPPRWSRTCARPPTPA